MVAVSKLGKTIFKIDDEDFEIKNNRIFPSIVKKIQKWSARWVSWHKRDIKRVDEGPQKMDADSKGRSEYKDKAVEDHESKARSDAQLGNIIRATRIGAEGEKKPSVTGGNESDTRGSDQVNDARKVFFIKCQSLKLRQHRISMENLPGDLSV